jgi:hypothetical protein
VALRRTAKSLSRRGPMLTTGAAGSPSGVQAQTMGGLKTEWEVGNIRVGAEVRMILPRQRGTAPIGGKARSVAGAALMPGKWRIAELVTDKSWHAVIKPASSASQDHERRPAHE